MGQIPGLWTHCPMQSLDRESKAARAGLHIRHLQLVSSAFISSPSTQLLCSCDSLCSRLLIGWMSWTTCRWSGLCGHEELPG